MKKALLIIFLLLCIALGGGYFYVSNLDWNSHKDVIAKQFFEATGKKIVFQGPISFAILPIPTLKASNVQIVNPASSNDSDPLMQIQSLDTTLDLWALAHGEFNVSIMSLSNPNIYVEKNEEGDYNWLNGINEKTLTQIEEAKLSFNSLILRNATLTYIDNYDIKELKLTNLNAEIIAQSLLGPFDIDGTYVKDNSPEGFSIKLGKISNRFATAINFSLSHPSSQTALRFDGSFLSENNSINGDVFFSSKKLMDFINANFKKFNLDKEYSYPLSFNFELKSNKEQTAISNFVFEYGGSKGAGSLIVPHNSENKPKFRPNVQATVNLTEFIPTPAISFIKKIAQQKNFAPNLSFDFVSDFKALKTTYNEQTVKNLTFSLDGSNNNFKIKNFEATLPGDSIIQLGGDIFSYKDLLSYSINLSADSNDFIKFLNWLNIKPEVLIPSTYKKASFTALFEGDTDKLKVGNLRALLDKTTATGNIGVIWGQRINTLIDLNIDILNLDNYTKLISPEESQKDFASQISSIFSRLSFLNKFDMQLNTKLGLIILNTSPYEKVNIMANLNNGLLNIADFSINSFANAKIQASGSLKGFGKQPLFENMKYSILSEDFANFANKMALRFSNIDYKKIKNFDAQGIISGNLNNFSTKSIFKFDTINASYNGRVAKKDGKFIYMGDILLRSMDFLAALNSLNISYNPPSYSLGLLALKAKIKGSGNQFTLNEMLANIGNNRFEGNFAYSKINNKPNITTDLKINTFESDRFFYNPSAEPNAQSFKINDNGNNTFIAQPEFGKSILDYSFYSKFNLDAKLNFNQLYINDYEFKNASMELKLIDSIADFNNFNAALNNGSISSTLRYTMTDAPSIKGKISLLNQKLNPKFSHGRLYGLSEGEFDLKDADFEMPATSFNKMFSDITTELNPEIREASLIGFNLAGIKEDLIKRENSTGLSEIIQKNLNNGQIKLPTITPQIKIINGKFSLENLNINLNDENIGINASGSLSEFDMLSTFNVKYPNLTYLPGFSFSLDGAISAPKLSINIDNLISMFEQRQSEFIDHKKRQEQEASAKLKKDMTSVQAIAQTLYAELNSLLANLKNKANNSASTDLANRYNLEANKLEQLILDINQIILTEKIPEYSLDLLSQLEAQNNEYKQKSQEIKSIITSLYLEDSKNKLTQSYNQLKKIYDESKEIARIFRKDFAEINSKLNNIDTIYRFKNDKNLTPKNKEIGGYILQIDEIYSNSTKEYHEAINKTEVAFIENANKQLLTQREGANNTLNFLKDNCDETLSYANAGLFREEQIWQERQRIKEMEAKIKENTGSLSIVDKGISMTVQKPLEEIIKDEAKDEDSQAKILDFSKEPDEAKPTETNKAPSGVIRISK